jgi:hypothetical protein
MAGNRRSALGFVQCVPLDVCDPAAGPLYGSNEGDGGER